MIIKMKDTSEFVCQLKFLMFFYKRDDGGLNLCFASDSEQADQELAYNEDEEDNNDTGTKARDDDYDRLFEAMSSL